MTVEEYKGYLQSPLLDGLHFEYDYQHITVKSSYTSFMNCVKLPKYNQKDILEVYSNIISLCKKQKVKIQYTNKWKQAILDNWKDYTSLYAEYNECYNRLLNMLPALEKSGIHKPFENKDHRMLGYEDDAYYNDVMRVYNQLCTYYHSNILSKISSIYKELVSLKEHLMRLDKMTLEEQYRYGKLTVIYL